MQFEVVMVGVFIPQKSANDMNQERPPFQPILPLNLIAMKGA
jgi:hypothetical protein